MRHKKKILVISANLEVGGIERSLIGLLGVIDYSSIELDLMLWRHTGPFFKLLPEGPRLLAQIPEYSTFQRSIGQILREGHVRIVSARLRAKFSSRLDGQRHHFKELVYLAQQRSWRYALPSLPMISGQYDLVLSFVGPHYIATDRVNAKTKVGWIHVDYRMIPTDGEHESEMWGNLDRVVAVSEECRRAFLNRFPQFGDRTMVIENILSPSFIRQQSGEFNASQEMPAVAGLTRILTVGRFSHAKGFDDAILACRKLIDIGCDIRWYAIGYGPDEPAMHKLIAANGLQDRFIILGVKINPYPYMCSCDLYVQPSRYEGKAVTVREAQILCKPVLITRFSTSASQVEDQVDGHICELGVDGIVAGVQRLVSDPVYRNRLAATAATRDYSNRDEVEKIYSLLRAI